MSGLSKSITVAKATSIDREAFKLTAVMTTNMVDRDGDIVEPQGLDTKEFMQNPVVLWVHDLHKAPIAKVNQIHVAKDSVLAEVEFDSTDPFSVFIFNKYADGFMRGWSIGFSGEKETLELIKDDDGNITGYHFATSKLAELSCVPVGANSQALTHGLGEISNKNVAVRFAKGLAISKDAEVQEAATTYLERVFTESDHNSEFVKDEPNWNSVDKKSLPLVAFAWQKDGTEAENKSTWEYPHHLIIDPGEQNDHGIYTTGAMKLSISGLRLAWSKCMSARSGAQAPVSVINHLQNHRKEAGIAENDRRKHYFQRIDTNGVESVHVEKLFEDASTLSGIYHEPSLLKLSPTAFKKSIDERGETLEVKVVTGEKSKVEIDFEVIQMSDDLIKEAKILQIVITRSMVEQKPESALKESDPVDGKPLDEEKKSGTAKVDGVPTVEENKNAASSLNARIAELHLLQSK